MTWIESIRINDSRAADSGNSPVSQVMTSLRFSPIDFSASLTVLSVSARSAAQNSELMGVVEGDSFYRRLVCPSGQGERQEYVGQGLAQGLLEGSDFIREE
jgi:hypothetical protein